MAMKAVRHIRMWHIALLTVLLVGGVAAAALSMREHVEQPLTAERATRLLREREFVANDTASFIENASNPTIIELFLASGINPNVQSELYGTALHRLSSDMSLFHSHGPKILDSVKLLLKYKANINAKDSHGKTPLMKIASSPPFIVGTPETQKTQYDFVRLLLGAGADPNVRDRHGHTLLMHAADHLQYGAVQALLEDNATDLNATDSRGETAFMRLVHSPLREVYKKVDDPSMVEKLSHALILKGVNLYAADRNKQTILYYAAPYPSVLKLLLENGLSPNQRDIYERTPLMTAASEGRAESVEILITAGADVNASDKGGHTAFTRGLQVAVALLHTDNFLRSRFNDDSEPLYRHHAKALRVLTKYGASYMPKHAEWVFEQLDALKQMNLIAK
jgi:ankyrin repeat protein